MASNYTPVAPQIRVYGGFGDIKKFPISINPRAFLPGTALWLNQVSGNYIAEPALLSPAGAATDNGAGSGTGSSYTSAAAAQAAFAPLFLGFAAEGRIPAQLNQFGNFTVACTASSPPYTNQNPMDASKPFISIYDRGFAQCPPGKTLTSTGALTSQLEVGTMVTMDTFVNEASYGFYDPSGTRQADTKYYLYNNSITTTATAADAIGWVVEQAPIGQTWIKIEFITSLNNYLLAIG